MKLWYCFGGPGSASYFVFDRLRTRLNQKLSAYLSIKAAEGRWTRILEAGSGPGVASSLLSRKAGVMSVALDMDYEALKEARRRDPLLPVVVGDLYRLPFAGSTFGLVWSSSTFEHLDKPADALHEMRRILSPQGCVFIGVPYCRGPLGFQVLIKKSPLGIWLGRVFSRNSLQAVMQEARFEPRESMLYFFHFFIGVLARKG